MRSDVIITMSGEVTYPDPEPPTTPAPDGDDEQE